MVAAMWKPAEALLLTVEQRAALEALARGGQTPQRVAARAMIVLAAADGPTHQRDRSRSRRQSPDGVSVARPVPTAGVLGLVKGCLTARSRFRP